MKEARIDVILESITKTLLVYLPEQAVEPSTFYEENYMRRDEIGMKSSIINIWVQDLIVFQVFAELVLYLKKYILIFGVPRIFQNRSTEIKYGLFFNTLYVPLKTFLFTANDLQTKSSNAEIAVIELVNKFLDSVPSKQINDLKNKW